MRVVILLIIALSAGACVKADATLVDPSARLAPTSNVELVLSEPTKPYSVIGMVEASGPVGTSDAELIEALRRKPARSVQTGSTCSAAQIRRSSSSSCSTHGSEGTRRLVVTPTSDEGSCIALGRRQSSLTDEAAVRGLEDMATETYEINGLSLAVLDPKDGPNAVNTLNLCEDFLLAAENLIRDEKSFIPSVGHVESYLACHALELGLKSFLLASRLTIRDLKGVGHDFERILSKVDEKGISKVATVSPYLRQAIDLMSNGYAGKHFEYVVSLGKADRVDVRHLLPEIRQLYETLRQVYAKASKQQRPPSDLTEKQAAAGRAVVDRLPADWLA